MRENRRGRGGEFFRKEDIVLAGQSSVECFSFLPAPQQRGKPRTLSGLGGRFELSSFSFVFIFSVLMFVSVFDFVHVRERSTMDRFCPLELSTVILGFHAESSTGVVSISEK